MWFRLPLSLFCLACIGAAPVPPGDLYRCEAVSTTAVGTLTVTHYVREGASIPIQAVLENVPGMPRLHASWNDETLATGLVELRFDDVTSDKKWRVLISACEGWEICPTAWSYSTNTYERLRRPQFLWGAIASLAALHRPLFVFAIDEDGEKLSMDPLDPALIGQVEAELARGQAKTRAMAANPERDCILVDDIVVPQVRPRSK